MSNGEDEAYRKFQAWHISSGLGFQIIERRESILDTIAPLLEVQEGCEKWAEWNLHYDQNDSGV